MAAAKQRLGKSILARLRPLCGDLTQPRFGLAEPAWKALSAEVDTIYHCAANVNMVLPYADLRADNVTATREVLRFACEGRQKHLHYASTLSVFVATDCNKGRLMETDMLDSTRCVYGGYAQTKWAAEWMLLQVPKEVCGMTHYRFGLITGDAKTGICAARDFLAMFAKGIIGLQAVPEGFDDRLFVDVTPVDYAAAAMAQLSLARKRNVYHIANPRSLSLGRLLQAIGQKGVGIRPVPVSEWKDIAQNRVLTVEETAAWLALCRSVPEEFERYRDMDLFQATDVTFDMTHRDADLKGLQCPEASDALLAAYMDYIFRT
jgi:thioester reductase-like protein